MRRKELKLKDIDLLQVYRKSNEVKIYAPWMKYAIPPLVIALLLGGVYGYLSYQKYIVSNEVSEKTAEIQRLQEEAANDPNAKLYEEIQLLKTSAKTYEQMYEKIASYPILQTGTFQAIEKSAYGDIQVTGLDYVRESQVITLQIETPSANGTETFVRRLKDTDTFSNVSYTGYNRIEKSNEVEQDTTATSSLTAEELLSYLTNAKNDITKATDTYEVYTATVLCTLK